MGKSVAQFAVRGWTREQVLGVAVGLGAQAEFTVENWGPNHVLLTKGSEVLSGRRLVTVIAADGPDGTLVTIQAWLEAGFDANVSPHHMINLRPRKETWWLASTLVSQLGVDPEAVFRHD